MISKQDGVSPRTAADLERKYQFGRTFAEFYGLITDARESAEDAVDDLDSKLNPEEIFNRLTNYGQAQGIYRENDDIYINASYIRSGTISADLINVNDLNLSGVISFDDLTDAEDVQASITSAQNTANGAASAAGAAYSTVSGWTYTGSTKIDGSKIMTGTVRASILEGGVINLLDSEGSIAGTMTLKYSQTNALDISSAKALRMQAASGYNAYLGTNGGPSLLLTGTGNNGRCQLSGGALVISSLSYGSALPSSGVEGQVYFVLA